MKITYNKERKTIIFLEGGVGRYKLTIFLCVFIKFNVCLSSFEGSNQNINIWLILGIVSAIYLIYHFLKKSGKSEYPIDEIQGLRKSSQLIAKHYCIELKNGKRRDLYFIKTEKDADLIRKVMQGELLEINTHSHLYRD